MTPREERGLVIAATCKLTQKGKVWLVPSQSGRGRYTVHPDSDSPFCSCPDFEETGCRCKHLFAVEYTMKRDMAKDGTVTETQSVTFTKKTTYKQDWPLYNLAQTQSWPERSQPYFSSYHLTNREVEKPDESGAKLVSNMLSGRLLWTIRFLRTGVSMSFSRKEQTDTLFIRWDK